MIIFYLHYWFSSYNSFLFFSCCSRFYNIHPFWICPPGVWHGKKKVSWHNYWVHIVSCLSGISLVLPIVKCLEDVVPYTLSVFLVVYSGKAIPMGVHPPRVGTQVHSLTLNYALTMLWNRSDKKRNTSFSLTFGLPLAHL